jgi:hypothetical protein
MSYRDDRDHLAAEALNRRESTGVWITVVIMVLIGIGAAFSLLMEALT